MYRQTASGAKKPSLEKGMAVFVHPLLMNQISLLINPPRPYCMGCHVFVCETVI